MPTYDYSCPTCGEFDAIRSMSQRNEPAACPECGTASARVFAAAPSLALMEGSTRSALETNERARHEPKSSRDYVRYRHPSGCGCCSTPTKRSATVRHADGSKTFSGKRPWMISH